MHIDIITPDKKVLEAKGILSATFPGINGSFQVLNNHANIISALEEGKVEIVSSTGTKKEIIVTGGVVEVINNTISVLAESVKL